MDRPRDSSYGTLVQSQGTASTTPSLGRQSPVVLRQASVPVTSSLLAMLEVPFVHKWLILSCMLFTITLGWLLLLVWPRTYESEAKLMIRVGRESVSLDPTATVGGQTLLIQKTRSEEVISALGVLGSRQVMEGVVNKIGGTAIIDGYLPSTGDQEDQSALQKYVDAAKTWLSDSLHSTLVSSGLRDEISDTEMAIRKLQDTTNISAPRESAVLSVNAVAKSPEMAQAIASGMTSTFIEEHLQVTRTPGSSKFFDRQADELETKLNKLVAERTDFMSQHDMISVTANQLILQEQLAAISKELLEANGQLRQAEAELADAKQVHGTLPLEIVATKVQHENATYSGMRQRLFELEVRERQLSSTVTTENPRLTVIREQIAEIRKIMSEVETEKVDLSTTPNPALQATESTIRGLQTRIAGLKSLANKKDSQRAAKTKEVEVLLQNQRALKQMDRDIALLESSLNALQVKQEESRVIDEMGRDQISNVSVFQPATFIERPIHPKKRVIAVLFTGVGMVLGLAIAYMREASSTRIRSRDQAAFYTGTEPVYALNKSWRLGSIRSVRRTPQQAKSVCKSVLSDLLLSEDWGEQRTLGVLGYNRGSGASTIAAQLAMVCSNECKLNTTLVDTDGKGRAVSTAFRLSRGPGLAEFAKGEATMDECLKPRSDKLALMPFSQSSTTSQLNGEFDGVVASLKDIRSCTNIVIVDLPAVEDSPEAIALARQLDYVVVVIESEKTTQDEATKLMRYMDAGNSKVLSVILNKSRQHLPRWLQRTLGNA